jgi:Bifunctional DNA primase/polymerase, N-terminal/Primase C terminal 1 (PriCT-1)
MSLPHALALAKKGIAVFPCWPNRKTPVCKHGLKEATTDSEIIMAWWSSYPTANIAAATGRISGVFVVDIDMKHGKNGEADLRALEAKHGPLPKTVESITPSKGRHLWFRMPKHSVPNSVAKIAPGIDIRGDGGYVLVPPSRVVEDYGAGSYHWSVDGASEFADAPEWLFPSADVSQLDTRRPPEHWQRISCGVKEGMRNQTLSSLAGYLLRKAIDPETTLELCLGWNMRCSPPLPEEEVVRTVESILKTELRRRGKAG